MPYLTHPKIAAILLAAGQSKRFGIQNKLLLNICGIPLIRRSALILLQANISDIIVVLGYQAQDIRNTLADLPLTFTINNFSDQGKNTSIRLGLHTAQQLYKKHDGVLIMLGDQPKLESDDLLEIIEAFSHQQKNQIILPVFHGQRGNPVLIPMQYCHAILNQPANYACREFIDNHPDLINRVESSTDHVTFDIDTLSAYDHLKNQLKPINDLNHLPAHKSIHEKNSIF